MYKVTALFRSKKIVELFYSLSDATEYRDHLDAHYAQKVTFRKVRSMREWVYNCWNGVMDHRINPLRAIPDLNTRHMIMQTLAWMWCIVFGIFVGSMYAGVISMMAHALLLAATAITVATFETAKRRPNLFTRHSGGAFKLQDLEIFTKGQQPIKQTLQPNETLMQSPVFEKGYPSYQSVNGMGDLKFTTAGDYMTMTTEGPFEEAFRADTAGVVRREIISYRVERGMMIKHCASRDYYESGDYHDSVNTTPLPIR